MYYFLYINAPFFLKEVLFCVKKDTIFCIKIYYFSKRSAIFCKNGTIFCKKRYYFLYKIVLFFELNFIPFRFHNLFIVFF